MDHVFYNVNMGRRIAELAVLVVQLWVVYGNGR